MRLMLMYVKLINRLVPPLPPRRFVHVTKFDPKVIEERRIGLAKFLQRYNNQLFYLFYALYILSFV